MDAPSLMLVIELPMLENSIGNHHTLLALQALHEDEKSYPRHIWHSVNVAVLNSGPEVTIFRQMIADLKNRGLPYRTYFATEMPKVIY